MFLFRKIGKVIRGAATPLQIQLACVLGAMLGFVPSFMRSPALVVGLVLLIAVLNANLALAGFVAGIAKLASLALMSVSFAVGRFLLDGPARGLFAKAINAPISALAGFEWYVCTGGLALGLVLGLLIGFIVNGALRGARLALLKVEEGGNVYGRHKQNVLVRFLLWLVAGSRHDDKSYRDLLTRRFGNPIRISGVIVAAIVIGGVWFAGDRLLEPWLEADTKYRLERANGATVDLGSLDLDLGSNRITIAKLAMADPEELDRDLFRAELLECDVSGMDLLRKRLKLDRVVVRDSATGGKRATPGVRIGPDREPSPPPPTSDPDEKTLDEWLATAEKWKDRLQQAKQWLDKLKRSPPAEDEPTLRDRLEKEVEEFGWREVAATHLIEGSPAFEIGTLEIHGIKSEKITSSVIDLDALHLSTHPEYVDEPARVTIKTRDGLYAIDAGLGSEARIPSRSFLSFQCTGLPAADLTRQIEAKTGVKTLEGGTIDAGFRLAWDTGGVAEFDTPLEVKLKDATITLKDLGSAKVKELTVPLSLRGPLDNPRVKLDAKRFGDELVKAGAGALGDKVKSEAQKRAGELEAKAKDKLNETVDDLLKGKVDKDFDKKLGDDAKKALDDLNPFGKKKKDKDKDKDGKN